MSRAQSPPVAAKKAERLRLQQRMEKLILAGVILVMIPGMVAYIFYARAPCRGRGDLRACQRSGRADHRLPLRRGATAGILFRNAEAIERMRQIDTVAVDKTGRLTDSLVQ